MMLTGRVYDAADGQAIGLSHYLVDEGEGLAKALELAKRIAENAPVTNFAVLQALPRIAESSPSQGYLLEALMAARIRSSASRVWRHASSAPGESSVWYPATRTPVWMPSAHQYT